VNNTVTYGARMTRPITSITEIYKSLADHQQKADWEYKQLAKELHVWADVFNAKFKLDVENFALRIDKLPFQILGHFRPDFNGFGLQGEIALNSLHLTDRPFWEVLRTLLHEFLHLWQDVHGTPSRANYHNAEFRRKALEVGLVVDREGHTEYAPNSVFLALLEEYGVEFPSIPCSSDDQRDGAVIATRKSVGKSKLKLWMCRCPIRLRIAVPDVQLLCLKCWSVFELQPEEQPHA
jgi:hypothetical protein